MVGRPDCNGCFHRDYPECDALVTNDPGVALMVFTADCTPILFHDPVTGAVGAAHAGWRGTASAIASKVVEAMGREFGSKPEDIRAFDRLDYAFDPVRSDEETYVFVKRGKVPCSLD